MFVFYVRDGEKEYGLSYTGDFNFDYWLENQDDEGMAVSEKDLFDMLDEYFKREY